MHPTIARDRDTIVAVLTEHPDGLTCRDLVPHVGTIAGVLHAMLTLQLDHRVRPVRRTGGKDTSDRWVLVPTPVAA